MVICTTAPGREYSDSLPSSGVQFHEQEECVEQLQWSADLACGHWVSVFDSRAPEKKITTALLVWDLKLTVPGSPNLCTPAITRKAELTPSVSAPEDPAGGHISNTPQPALPGDADSRPLAIKCRKPLGQGRCWGGFAKEVTFV